MIKEWLSILGVKKHPEDETVDTKVNIHTLYKHRWVWYHKLYWFYITNTLGIVDIFIYSISLFTAEIH